LRGPKISLDVPKLKAALQAAFVESRPGQKKTSELEVLVNGEKKRLRLGEKLFLSYKEGFGLASQSPLSVVFIWEKNQLAAEAALALGDGLKWRFEIEPSGLEKSGGELGLGLKEARYLPADLFALKYASEEKLKAPRLETAEACLYLKEGGLYVFQQGFWQEAGELQNLKTEPLMRVLALRPQELFLELWEKEEKRLWKAPLSLEKPAGDGRTQQFQDLHLRTCRQVSLRIEKQRMILRKGDLIFKKEGRWQLIKNPPVDRKLLETLRGKEFFLVEEIEQGKVFKGAFFNSEHTRCFPVEKNLAKNSEKKTRRMSIR
jgi:hypothetical protein